MPRNAEKSAPIPIIAKIFDNSSINFPSNKQRDYEHRARYCGFLTCIGAGGDVNYARKTKRDEDVEGTTKGTQTDYRESETQTSPWEAPYRLPPGIDENPEILCLSKTKWGDGLPAGMHQLEIIKRMRMKKAWMDALPPMDTPSNIKIRTAITAAIEANEWAFREAEIQFIMDTRMELMETMAADRRKVKEQIADERMERFAKRLGQRRDKELQDIRGKFQRELRKLRRKHRASSAASFKKRRPDIITQYADRTSQIYAPEMRFGDRSLGRHEVLNKSLLGESCIDEGLQPDDARRWLPTDQQLQETRPSPGPEDLCVRQTRWSDEKLRKLHSDLKAIRLNISNRKDRKGRPTLMKPKFKVPPLPVTPIISGANQMDKHLDNSSLLIQKITRGRAIQSMMFEGRDRCRELIEELRFTHTLEESARQSPKDDKSSMLAMFQEQNEKYLKENRLCEILDSLEGVTVAGMLDMLSKEDTRLREERRAHALVMLAERERNRREAEESGRRQLERNRRRELDEMFRQVVKVNQDSVEAYLEDIVKEGIDWVSDEQARQYVVELADKIDESIDNPAENYDTTSHDEEMIADMVQNFLLPEVDKQMVRKKMRQSQQRYLRDAHNAIYSEMENISSEEKNEMENITSEGKNAMENITSEGKNAMENISSLQKSEMENISLEEKADVGNISSEKKNETENESSEDRTGNELSHAQDEFDQEPGDEYQLSEAEDENLAKDAVDETEFLKGDEL